MEVKTCPKCNWQNKPASSVCTNCNASLEGVQVTGGTQQAGAAGTQSPAPQPPAAGSANPYGPPAASTNGPEFRERPSSAQPAKSGPNVGIILFVLLLLGGAAFGGWWFFVKPKGPEVVVQNMLDAQRDGDFDKMKASLTQSSLDLFKVTPGVEETIRKSMKRDAGPNKGGKVIKTTYEDKTGSSAIVEVKPDDPSTLPPGMTSAEIVCVQENHQWKVDLRETGMRAMRKMMGGKMGMPGH